LFLLIRLQKQSFCKRPHKNKKGLSIAQTFSVFICGQGGSIFENLFVSSVSLWITIGAGFSRLLVNMSKTV